MRRLAAVEALGRGGANVRANPELVGVAFAGTIASAALLLLSLVPGLWALGVDASWFSGDGPDPARLVEAFGRLGSPLDALGKFGGVLLGFSLALTLASLLYGWYQGGILGVLVAGDAQAPFGRQERVLFRTWSPGLFLHEARRLTWKLLLFYSLFLGLWTAVGLLTLGLFVGAGLAGKGAGVAAGCGLACGLLLPLLFVAFTLFAASQIGQADLVRPGSGVWSATRSAFAILGRRLGAGAALCALLVVVSVTLGVVFSSVELVVDLLLAEHLAPLIALRVVLGLLQLLASSAIGLIFAAAFVALARSEAALLEDAAR